MLCKYLGMRIEIWFQIKQQLNSGASAKASHMRCFVLYSFYTVVRLRDKKTAAVTLKTCVGFLTDQELIQMY